MNATSEPKLGDIGSVGLESARPKGGQESAPVTGTLEPVRGLPGFRGRSGRIAFLTHLGASLTVPGLVFAVALDPLHAMYEANAMDAYVLAAVAAFLALQMQF